MGRKSICYGRELAQAGDYHGRGSMLDGPARACSRASYPPPGCSLGGLSFLRGYGMGGFHGLPAVSTVCVNLTTTVSCHDFAPSGASGFRFLALPVLGGALDYASQHRSVGVSDPEHALCSDDLDSEEVGRGLTPAWRKAGGTAGGCNMVWRVPRHRISRDEQMGLHVRPIQHNHGHPAIQQL